MGPIKEISNPVEYEEEAELDYFLGIMDNFLNAIAQDELTPDNKFLTVIARSPSSNIARAISHYSDDFANYNIRIKAIFAQISSTEYLSDWLDPEQSPCGKFPEKNIRWARRKNLVDAHEQLTLGNIMSWTGESMRREVDARFGFYIFNENCHKSALLAQRSFQAFWQVSQEIPNMQIKRSKTSTNNFTSQPTNNQTNLSFNTPELYSPAHTIH